MLSFHAAGLERRKFCRCHQSDTCENPDPRRLTQSRLLPGCWTRGNRARSGEAWLPLTFGADKCRNRKPELTAIVAPFAHGVVDPWPVHFKTGPPRNGAF